MHIHAYIDTVRAHCHNNYTSSNTTDFLSISSSDILLIQLNLISPLTHKLLFVHLLNNCCYLIDNIFLYTHI